MAWGMAMGHPWAMQSGGSFLEAVPCHPGHFHRGYGDFLTSNHLNCWDEPNRFHSVIAEPQPSLPKKSPQKALEVLQPQETIRKTPAPLPTPALQGLASSSSKSRSRNSLTSPWPRKSLTKLMATSCRHSAVVVSSRRVTRCTWPSWREEAP